jgi:hypothetical protein
MLAEWWCYSLSGPLARSYGERAAFLWRHGPRLRLAGVTKAEVDAGRSIFNQHSCAAFGIWEGSHPDEELGLARGIYTAKFTVHAAGSGKLLRQLLLFSVHTSPSNLTVELASHLPALIEQHVYKDKWHLGAAGDKQPHQLQGGGAKAGGKGAAAAAPPPVVAFVGDFNRQAGHPDFRRLRQVPDAAKPLTQRAGCGFTYLLPPGAPTNLSGTQQYDNLWVPQQQREMWAKAANVLPPPAGVRALGGGWEAMRQYSDHCLVYADLQCGLPAGAAPAAGAGR